MPWPREQPLQWVFVTRRGSQGQHAVLRGPRHGQLGLVSWTFTELQRVTTGTGRREVFTLRPVIWGLPLGNLLPGLWVVTAGSYRCPQAPGCAAHCRPGETCPDGCAATPPGIRTKKTEEAVGEARGAWCEFGGQMELQLPCCSLHMFIALK